MKRLLAIITCIALTFAASGQTRDSQLRAKVDSLLTARYQRTPYDTNFVVRPEGRLTLKVRLSQSGNDFHARGTVNGVYSRADLSTSHKTTLSLAASYRGISASLSMNPAKLRGIYKDYEMNVNYYSSKFSLDASYQRSTSLAGDIKRDNGIEQMESGDITMKVLNVAGYYVFNNRRFSYPAAFTQSYVQRRSAGSWLAGISYQGGSLETTSHLIDKNPKAPDARIYIGHFGIGGGYAYNWVFGSQPSSATEHKKWLFHFSMLPTFVVYNRNNMKLRSAEDRQQDKAMERRRAQRTRFNMLFNERAAIIHNFSPRHFAGITLTMNNSVFDDDVVVVNQNKWRLHAFLGIRL